METNRKPLAVFMSGAPGSGKSYLADKIAGSIGLFQVERDKLKHGIEYSAGERGDRSKTIIPTYFKAIEQLLGLGISLVADGALYRDQAASQLAEGAKLAYILIVHCRSKHSDERFFAREREEHGTSADWEREYRDHLDWVKNMTSVVLDLPFPTLEVKTDGEYEPNLAYICSWVNTEYGATLSTPDHRAETGRVA